MDVHDACSISKLPVVHKVLIVHAAHGFARPHASRTVSSGSRQVHGRGEIGQYQAVDADNGIQRNLRGYARNSMGRYSATWARCNPRFGIQAQKLA